MGKVTKKILGATRGKVGDVVFRKFRQMNVDSAYQPTPANPRTEAQMIQRSIFGEMSRMAHATAQGINIGLSWKAKSSNLSPRNWFVRLNKNNFTSSNPGIVQVSYQELIFSTGDRMEANFSPLDLDNPLEVGISWSAEATAVDEKAELYFVVYSPDAKEAVVSGAAKLEDHGKTVTVPAHWNALKVYVYAIEVAVADHPEYNIVKGQTYRSTYIGTGNIG